MKKFISIFIIFNLLFFSNFIQAGIASKSIKGYVAYQAFAFAVRHGSPWVIKKGAKTMVKYLKSNPHFTQKAIGFMTGVAISQPEIRERAMSFIKETNLLNNESVNDVIEASKEYDDAYDIVESKLGNINTEDLCYKRLDQGDYREYMLNLSSKPTLFDVGSYGYMKNYSKYAVAGDQLEHDHVPSKGAIFEYFEDKNNKKLKTKIKNLIENNATAIEIDKDMHKIGRTWGSHKNNPVQIELDSKNLQKATFKDFSYHLMNYGVSSKILNSFVFHYKRNASLCLYED